MSRSERSPLLLIALGVGLGGGLGIGALAWWQSASRLTAPESVLSAPLEETWEADAGSLPSEAAALTTPGRPGSRPTRARKPGTRREPAPELTAPHEWPAEPASPPDVDERRFTEALVLLCGPHADDGVRTWYAPFILRAAREHGADPFLLGGLTFFMSGCTEQTRRGGLGVTGLDPELYRQQLSQRTYRYTAFENGTWVERTRRLARFPFDDAFLASAESNLYFAAALLATWQDQLTGLRAAFVQPAEYRHYVSHYVWGDQVRSHREEDAILVERRRLLEYYGAIPPAPAVRWRGFQLGCPLDGCPRVVTSTLGDAREGGARLHAGNDFESSVGEPVRAIADGVVLFAGVDLPGKGAASRIPIWAQRNVDPSTMGAGGLYVCIDHGQSGAGEKLVSCSMHLETATVVQGRKLRRGDQVGRVGTSGIKESRPHLHFELHSSGGVHRATDVLAGLALGHPVTHAARPGARSNHSFSRP